MSGGFLALELDGDGAHPAAWRAARHAPTTLLSGDRLRGVALAAESAGFHVATFADGPVPVDAAGETENVAGRLDAVQRAAFAALATRSLVVVPEVDTVYTEPFHIATQLASLDYVTGGRAGWLVAAQTQPSEAAAVGRDTVPAADVAAEAAASVEVGRRLWDSWEDDAVIRDVPTGRYLDVEQLHYADFATGPDFPGAGYTVKGPAIIPRPLQGQLPILAPAGLFAADDAAVDVVLVTAATVAGLAPAAGAARAAGAAGVVLELDVVLDARGQDASERLAALDAHTPWPATRARYVGDAAGLVALLTELLAVADGVRLHPAALEADLEELGRLVLPALRRTGSLAPVGQDTTFRGLLGLSRPVNRYAATRADASAATDPEETP